MMWHRIFVYDMIWHHVIEDRWHRMRSHDITWPRLMPRPQQACLILKVKRLAEYCPWEITCVTKTSKEPLCNYVWSDCVFMPYILDHMYDNFCFNIIFDSCMISYVRLAFPICLIFDVCLISNVCLQNTMGILSSNLDELRTCCVILCLLFEFCLTSHVRV